MKSFLKLLILCFLFKRKSNLKPTIRDDQGSSQKDQIKVREAPLPRFLRGSLIVLLAVFSFAFGISFFSSLENKTRLGTFTYEWQFSSNSTLDLYIPLADWGVRANAFQGPLTLKIEPKRLDRGALLGVRSSTEALEGFQEDVLVGARASLLRGSGAALLIALILTLLFILYQRQTSLARRASSFFIVLLTILFCTSSILVLQSSFDKEALSEPTFYAQGQELFKLLEAAERARKAGNSYIDRVDKATFALSTLLEDGGRLTNIKRNPTLTITGDLHDNVLSLGAFNALGGGGVLLMVGDFSNEGSLSEAKLVGDSLGELNQQIIAIAGNHDSKEFMIELAKEENILVLTDQGRLNKYGEVDKRPIVTVLGHKIAAWQDPLSELNEENRRFSFNNLEERDKALNSLISFFSTLDKPDILLVHQNGLAQDLAHYLYESGYTRPLLIATGHDHLQHVDEYGPISVVDGGSIGAGGVAGLNHDWVGFANVYQNKLTNQFEAVDLISYQPTTDQVSGKRVSFDRGCSGFCAKSEDEQPADLEKPAK